MIAAQPWRAPEPLDPAPDGATWSRCGHPRTPENTQSVGLGRDRCRICRRAIVRESLARRRERNKRPNK